MSISNGFLRFGVIFALIGVCMGIGMGATGDFALAPVHAHVNLLGWASMFLYGLFYRVAPDAARGWIAKAHLGLAVTGMVVFTAALAAKLAGGPAMNVPAELGLAIGPLLVVIGMILFAVIVFRATGRAAVA